MIFIELAAGILTVGDAVSEEIELWGNERA